jgi:hypothetical protein
MALRPPTVQLLLYDFGSDAEYEGRLLGALERIEAGGALHILGALFIASDAQTGELATSDLSSRGAGSLVSPLLGFRLDEAQRRRATKRTFEADGNGLWGDTLRQLGARLAPGAAIAVVLVEHTWARALEDAISRTGRRPLVSSFVDAASLEQLGPELLAAVE